jgi:serine/threonine protein kinase
MARPLSGYPTGIDLEPGTVIDGRYAVDRLVGRGGLADVFRAGDLVTGDRVAVKILRACDPPSLARFRTEIDVLQRLEHPAVVRLRRWGAHHDQPYLVLDLVEGPTLAGLLLDGPVDEAASVAAGLGLAEALAYAHGLGVVHRDVKPSNVLLDRDPFRPRLADFDIARLAGDAERTAGTGIGTAAYVAPEQLDGRVGPPADVYALGLVLIECLTGEVCFPGSMAEAALARLQRSPAVPTDLAPWLRQTLVAMTDRSAERRPPAGAVAAALRVRSADPLDLAPRPRALRVPGRAPPKIPAPVAVPVANVSWRAGGAA